MQSIREVEPDKPPVEWQLDWSNFDQKLNREYLPNNYLSVGVEGDIYNILYFVIIQKENYT